MNRRILRLAIPNIISNITIPLLGMVDTAIAGRLGGESSIGAIAIGTAIFGFIYWNCAFIRMGTSGLTAQALGARDMRETAGLLVRSVVVALGIAALLLLLQGPLGRFSIGVMQAGGETKRLVGEYFYARIWAAPATVSLYSIHGWFIGMQNAKIPMWVAICQNVVNITFSWWFAIGLGMGVAGVAWGTVVSQYFGVLMSWTLWWIYYRRFTKYIDWKDALRIRPMLRFFDVNKDIFLRTAMNTCVYTFFTWSSSGFGDVLLATNSILIQLFTFFSYMLDGFAYAAEAITGKFTGARNFTALRKAVKYMFWWCGAVAVVFVFIYLIFWQQIIGIFTESPAIMETAGQYIIWIMLVPLVGFAPFLMDGILIGATRTKILRNSMLCAAAVFFPLYYILLPGMGNDALWISFVTFIVIRAVTQYFMSDRLRVLYK